MSNLDWYLRLNERCKERGYDLSLLICPDSETVVRKIIPKAVEIACRNARKQNRRDGPSRKHWKMHFTDSQLYQIGILEASQFHAKLASCHPAYWLIRYIAFLSLCTLQRNSFYVAVGFERILNAGSSIDMLELYEWLSYRFTPDDPPIGRDEKSANDICSILHEQLYREFKDTLQTEGHRLTFDKVPKGSGGISDEIYRILDKMIPWETNHLPNARQAHARSHQRIMAEMSLAHVCIDQQRCLEYVKHDNKRISQSFDTWKIPIPNSVTPDEPSDPPAPCWQDVKEEIMKEIHWSEEKSRRGWGAEFEVVVDGEIKESVAPGGLIEISLSPLARYVEIRNAENKVLVANCHLMDPQDLPETGWKTSVEVPARGRINFEFFPERHVSDMAGLSMRVGVDVKRAWATSIRNRFGQVLQPLAWRGRGESLAYAASLMLVLLATFLVLLNQWRVNQRLNENSTAEPISNLQAQLNQLQRENAELQAQLSNLSALETQLAELQRFNAEVLNSSSQTSQALYDGSRLVAFDRQGNLIGLETMPRRLQQLIRTALMTGRVDAPDLRGLGRGAAKLMGENVDSETFTLISPVGVVVETDRPTFRWKPLKGATNYKVIISDANYNEVVTSNPISETQWIIDRPLERGKVYSWQVVALKEGEEIETRNAPGMLAKIHVLDQAKLDDLAQAKKANPHSHLVMGLLYAKAGLLDDAEREFKALLAANQKSSAARKLLHNVEALRRAR